MTQLKTRVAAYKAVGETPPPAKVDSATADVQEGLVSALAKLGLDDAELAKVSQLLETNRPDVLVQAMNGKYTNQCSSKSTKFSGFFRH